jgi:iron-sulfur cluster assembly accessory protein
MRRLKYVLLVQTDIQIIKLTDAAREKIRELIEENPGKVFRLFVEAGGCSGFNYGMSITEPLSGDEQIEPDLPAYIDPACIPYLKGSVLDHIDQLTQTGFRIQNPNAKATCGCGTSFEA